MSIRSNTQHTLPDPSRRARWPAAIAVGALIVVGGAGGVAFGAGMPGVGGWGHGGKLAKVQDRVHASLESVGATTEQEAQIHDIVAKTFTGLETNGFDRDAARKQMLDLLRAPTVDRAAIEKLRAEQVAKVDAVSKSVVGALEDAADKLNPEQRAKLADRVAEMTRHHHGDHQGERRSNDGGKPGTDERGSGQPDGGTPDHG